MRLPTIACVIGPQIFGGCYGAPTIYPATEINLVSDCGAVGNDIVDDGPALISCQQRVAGMLAEGQQAIIRIPPGNYNICTALPMQAWPVSYYGAGPTKTLIKPCATYSGDLFSWSEVWYGAGTSGVEVTALGIVGIPSASAQQNALVFYDRADDVRLKGIEITNINGRGIYSGITKNQPISYMRESRLDDIHIFNTGATSAPCFELNSQGNNAGQDASNEIRGHQIDIVACSGTSLLIHNSYQSNQGVRDITISQLRIEGLQGAAVAADLLQIGDDALLGNVNNITISDSELIDPYTGYSAIRFTAPSSVSQPYQIHFAGLIGGGLPNGDGIKIDAGRSLYLDITAMHTFGTNLTVAYGAGPNIVINGYGTQSSWTTSIAGSVASGIMSPTLSTFP
jgi:hypothetical protein